MNSLSHLVGSEIIGKKRASRQRLPVLILLLYAALSFPYLDRAPLIHQDEPWIASTAWAVATEGRYASAMFADYYGMEERYYLNLPMQAILSAPLYAVAGVGLWQARWTTVAMGAVTLALTYALGKRVAGTAAGVLAMLLLLFVSHTDQTTYRMIGVLFTDGVRIARYDNLVPIFTILALLQFRAAQGNGKERHYFLTGVWIACAALSNLYGIFWLGVFALVTLFRRGGWRALLTLAGGFALPLLPVLLYIAADYPAFRAQTMTHAPRFGLNDARWYVENWQNEWMRYEAGIHPRGWMRPGLWVARLGLPLSLLLLARRAWRRNSTAQTLLAGVLLIPLAFALLITVKRQEYLLMMLPVWAVCVAWGVQRLWQRAARGGVLLLRSVAITLSATLLLLAADAGTRYLSFYQRAAEMPSYYSVEGALQARVPQGARILGLHTYWFAFVESDYRTWYTFLVLAGSGGAPVVRPLEESLERFNPQVILVDPAMTRYFAAEGTAAQQWQEVKMWMAEHSFTLRESVELPAYGTFQIYSAPP